MNNKESRLRQAYNGVVVEGKSLRAVSEEIGIDRKSLKKLMEEILSQEELEQFNNALNKRNNHLKEGTSDKKIKALRREEYKDAIEILAKEGIQPEMIEKIYARCQEKPQTKIARDTLVIKLVQLLEFFKERNIGISLEESGYISNQDVVDIILKNPRIINSDITENIKAKCIVITDKKEGNVKDANLLIKSNPGIFRKSIKVIKEGR